MDPLLEEILEEILKEREQEAKIKSSREIAKRVIALGNISLEEIAKATHLSLEEVQTLAREQSAT